MPTTPVNPPLQQIDENAGYRLTNRTLGEKNSDRLFVILSLSGGGARVEALDYGVIGFLDRIRFGADDRSLLDEVDIISSSSASSIPAAYCGLYGKDTFLDDFVEDVLYRKLETSLRRRLVNPLEWPRTASGNFSRGDLLAEFSDKRVFDGRSFADMQRQRPLVMLNTTDMGIGAQFSFVQGYFDLIADPVRRSRFQAIHAALELPREDVDMLIEIAPQLLLEDPEFQTLIEDLGAHIADRAAGEPQSVLEFRKRGKPPGS